MAYEKRTWVDGQNGGTPIKASSLNAIEQGIQDADSIARGAMTKAIADTTYAPVSEVPEAYQDYIAEHGGGGPALTVIDGGNAAAVAARTGSGGVIPGAGNLLGGSATSTDTDTAVNGGTASSTDTGTAYYGGTAAA